MSRSRKNPAVAVAAVLGFLAGSSAIAQTTEQLPSGSVTYPVHFPTGASAIGPEDKDTVRAVASRIKNTPDVAVTIIGKADTVGSADFNNQLAEKRTQAVFEELVYTNQVPENRVEMRWTGENLPLVSSADEQAQLQNRVVMIILH
jgi:OOP family OmpA-OmpF porin